jgi:hypothetical protein
MEKGNVEIEQESAAQAFKAKVRQNLRSMDREKMFHGFQFNRDRTNDEVDPIPAIEWAASVDRWNRDLASKLDATEAQFFRQTFLIRGLEETGSEFPMNLDGRSNDVAGETVPVVQVLSKQ